MEKSYGAEIVYCAQLLAYSASPLVLVQALLECIQIEASFRLFLMQVRAAPILTRRTGAARYAKHLIHF
jgi:hypothetical protein